MKIKNYFKPQELVFTTDDVVCDGIGQAVQKYEKAVSLALMEYTRDLKQLQWQCCQNIS